MGQRVAVLVSGSGTNLQALLDDPELRPHLALVLSDRSDVFALERASVAGVESAVIDPADFGTRADFEEAVASLLRDRGIDVLVSAGYLRLLGAPVLDAYAGRWLNVHPSLLPAFPGMHAVRDALAYRAKVTGVTVFLVDEGIDTGPVVLQEAIAIRDDDDWDALESRVHAVEHRLLPAALRALLRGDLQVTGRHVRIAGDAS
jgi:phosphoribosylglycinamide formyltransferase-1